LSAEDFYLPSDRSNRAVHVLDERHGNNLRITSCFIIAVLMSHPSVGQGQVPGGSYEIRPGGQSRFELEVHKSKLWEGRKHTFAFDRYQGVLHFNAHRPEASNIELSVVSASGRCVDDWVKRGQIEDIEKAARATMAADVHPEIRFRSTAISAVSPNRYDVRGMLTIRHESRPVVLSVTAEPGESGLRLTGTGSIKLTTFGLRPPRGAVFLFIGTKDEMTVRFDLLAKRTGQ
jgi:polyisoprenoid-binding protein YceI